MKSVIEISASMVSWSRESRDMIRPTQQSDYSCSETRPQGVPMGVVSKNDTVECITRAKAFWNMLYPAARLETLSGGVTVSAMPRIRETGQHSRQRVTDAEREESSANTQGSICTHVV